MQWSKLSLLVAVVVGVTVVHAAIVTLTETGVGTEAMAGTGIVIETMTDVTGGAAAAAAVMAALLSGSAAAAGAGMTAVSAAGGVAVLGQGRHHPLAGAGAVHPLPAADHQNDHPSVSALACVSGPALARSAPAREPSRSVAGTK